MHQLELLRSLWSKRAKRKTDLIVPKVSYNTEQMVGSLNNDDWYFKVPYAFRETLDIKYEERKKNKKGYMVWTQGPILSFKEGDTFTDRNNESLLQVIFSNPMGWDNVKDCMYQGSVLFDQYEINNQKYTKVKQHSCNQMEFLKILIAGLNNS